jgi:glycosyltransferase involved in cell wall biosynthesis
MRIGFIVENSKTSGGSYYQTLNFLNDIKKNFKKKNHISVYTNKKENLKIFDKKVNFFSYNFLDRIIIKFSFFHFFRLCFKLINLKTNLEKTLLKKKVDLIIFPAPSNLQYTIIKIKFISTIFDLCHLEHKNFPEISIKEFQIREKYINYISSKAKAIITNSTILQKQISKKYNFQKKNIFVVPFNPTKKIIKKEKTFKIKYFFYPANFWKHKNHEIIIKATKLLVNKNFKNFKCIFSGSDKGYLNEIIKLINSNNLNEFFKIKKFVSDNELSNLYVNCSAVIMTSHFGPTNLPPLEAFTYKKPLIYNKKFSKEISDRNCLMINVNNESDLSQAMSKVLKNNYLRKMKLNAENFLRLKKIQNIKSIISLENFLEAKY